MKYNCKNGAFHSNECCDTCWNKHPEAVKGEMFMLSRRCGQIILQDLIESCIQAGFTESQAEFLLNSFKRYI